MDRCELLIFLGRTEDLVPRFLHTTLKLYQACFFYSLKIYKNIKICFFLGWKRRGWRWARELWLWIMNHVDIIKLMILKQDKQLILRQHKADWTQRRTHWLSPTLKAASSRSWLVTKFQYYPFQHHLVSANDMITNNHHKFAIDVYIFNHKYVLNLKHGLVVQTLFWETAASMRMHPSMQSKKGRWLSWNEWVSETLTIIKTMIVTKPQPSHHNPDCNARHGAVQSLSSLLQKSWSSWS